MTNEEENALAFSLFTKAIRDGYTTELYDLHVTVDDENKRLVLSPRSSPVTLDSPRRKKYLPDTERENLSPREEKRT